MFPTVDGYPRDALPQLPAVPCRACIDPLPPTIQGQHHGATRKLAAGSIGQEHITDTSSSRPHPVDETRLVNASTSVAHPVDGVVLFTMRDVQQNTRREASARTPYSLGALTASWGPLPGT